MTKKTTPERLTEHDMAFMPLHEAGGSRVRHRNGPPPRRHYPPPAQARRELPPRQIQHIPLAGVMTSRWFLQPDGLFWSAAAMLPLSKAEVELQHDSPS